jgi:hypothetical protein
MSREYFIKRTRPTGDDDYWWDAYGPDMLARTVIETEEVYDTGMLDENGNKIMAREKKNPIGFVWKFN